MKPNTNRIRSQRGSAAVEFAVVTPLLLTVILGIVDVGNMLFV